MIRLQRVEARESLRHNGRSFSLVSWTWMVGLGGPGVGLGWRYQHPVRIESESSSTPVYDYLFLARIAAALGLLAITTLMRRSPHD